MTALLVFAVVPADRFDAAVLTGGDGLPPGLRSITAGPLAAVVGAAPEGGLKGREREALLPWLLSSQKVMERLLACAPVLPVALGTVVAEEGRVRRLLEGGAGVLHEALDIVGDRVEMELSVRWHLDGVVARLLGGVATELRQAARNGDEPARRALGTLLAVSVAEERQKVKSRLVARLRAASDDLIVSEPTEPDGVLNLALLVERGADDALLELLNALDAEFGGELTFRLVGPLPPYSFASVQVHLAPAEAVRRARAELGVEPGASLEAVKAAYRRAARESHPDLAASGEPFNSTPVREETREVARFVVLSDAYRVLEAEHVPVSLRRQEASLD
ncbi:GvpL/GvpF family gas vesicle protein [Ancylobacter dichloromethanicus]|uniref:J domain-containing protein n=1 Tax=Ancylobacter dichloromethanicus TaxID=518825 RepID=A0A9W6J8W0_9HYPH|nr:GvpL/GvpF family gas vesicle protein [Ancylobacter dichloromethanicus]MBS7554281.1 GvpL/GvpF family gas vesicle protein [Ancylobacter dichloromethanicus]GLK71405.1 hypothetical protein GCM10017643_15200 [Ancylobacter dichloromethanicus]